MWCPQVTVHPTCKIKNHNPLHICPLLQNPAAKEVWDHKGYHLDDPFHGHARVNEDNMMWEVFTGTYMFPVTSNLMPSQLHPSRMYGPQGIWFYGHFHDHDWGTTGAHQRNIDSKEVPHRA